MAILPGLLSLPFSPVLRYIVLYIFKWISIFPFHQPIWCLMAQTMYYAFLVATFIITFSMSLSQLAVVQQVLIWVKIRTMAVVCEASMLTLCSMVKFSRYDM